MTARTGLTEHDSRALEVLLKADRPLTATELAHEGLYEPDHPGWKTGPANKPGQALIVNAGSTLTRLGKHGYVERATGPERGKRWQLTARGCAIASGRPDPGNPLAMARAMADPGAPPVVDLVAAVEAASVILGQLDSSAEETCPAAEVMRRAWEVELPKLDALTLRPPAGVRVWVAAPEPDEVVVAAEMESVVVSYGVHVWWDPETASHRDLVGSMAEMGEAARRAMVALAYAVSLAG